MDGGVADTTRVIRCVSSQNRTTQYSGAYASASSGRRVYIIALLATMTGNRPESGAPRGETFDFRPDGDGERRANHGGERDEAPRRWCVKSE